MSKIIEKHLQSEAHIDELEDMSEDADKQQSSQRNQVTPLNGVEPSSLNQEGFNTGGDFTGTHGKNKLSFKEPTKKKIQLSFENVLIQTVPQQRRFCNKNAKQEKPKVILNSVSGCIQPGQFLAIIGASGKSLGFSLSH